MQCPPRWSRARKTWHSAMAGRDEKRAIRRSIGFLQAWAVADLRPNHIPQRTRRMLPPRGIDNSSERMTSAFVRFMLVGGWSYLDASMGGRSSHFAYEPRRDRTSLRPQIGRASCRERACVWGADARQ